MYVGVGHNRKQYLIDFIYLFVIEFVNKVTVKTICAFKSKYKRF